MQVPKSEKSTSQQVVQPGCTVTKKALWRAKGKVRRKKKRKEKKGKEKKRKKKDWRVVSCGAVCGAVP